MKIRVAIAVDKDGAWNATGCSGLPDSEAMDLAVDCVADGEARYWVECEVDPPKDITIQGIVTKAA